MTLSPEATAPEFVTFLVRPRNGGGSAFVTIPLKQPIRLYDESRGAPYRKVRARAWKQARRELECSPSMPMLAEPHDWSDGVGALSEQPPESHNAGDQ
jgi:hypothetical protein